MVLTARPPRPLLPPDAFAEGMADNERVSLALVGERWGGREKGVWRGRSESQLRPFGGGRFQPPGCHARDRSLTRKAGRNRILFWCVLFLDLSDCSCLMIGNARLFLGVG